ncbi:heme exporter protein C [Roseibium sp. TrichSKD4]|uniref:heme ABC transporter permease n=1 Tax=Roseibium sp. TrichSKD4 TaxID=744980 RepID=UPI0001E56C2A|nr:heme ABC transporter permease [Roseibium sp. TrichSKD4]EFO32671.1 heme exporter protein C [Roseibium sp. TrichSKD4]
MAIWDYANPTRFMRLADRILPWLIGICVIAFAIGLYKSFFMAPEDYQQGDTVRIMFIHVPAAWLAMMCYSVMALSSIGTLVWKHPLADVSAKCAALIGAAFTFISLVTGSLWGKPMWGTYWVWDARLTSVLVLFIMYLGLMALWRTMEDPIKAGKAAAVLTLVGALNLPIIKFSVDWWNTLHQPASVMRLDGPTIHPDMLVPLLVMAFAFSVLFFVLHLRAMQNEVLRRRVRTMRQKAAASARPAAATATTQPAE